MQNNIIIAEDNTELSDMMKNYLEQAGYAVHQAFDGEEALKIARSVKPDLVLLDIMMPVLDGYQVCPALRVLGNFPIIIVSAKILEEEKLKMFELGADDYITKPFSFKEMVGRVNAQIRRFKNWNTPTDSERRYGQLTINSTHYEAKVGSEVVPLTAKEFKLLDVLTLNANRIFDKQKLIDAVWGTEEYIDENTVAVTVARLRDKLKHYSINNVVTVWGLGYKWQD